jgi:hypothetical protein
MNLFELQERLKDFSQEQLVREMQAPTGSAPQFLVLSELQRRQRMMAEEQAQMQTPQTTVAEDAIAAAGMPQGGLADMARSMAPQTDMDMNTAVQPVERMQEGGSVDGRDSGFIRRLLESVGERARNSRMTDEEIRFLRDERPIPKRLIDALNPGQSAADARDSYEEGDYPGAVINAASAFPLGKIAGPAANVLAELYSRAGDRELEPVSEFPIGMADGGVVRMQPGGLASISRDIRDFAPRLPAEIAGVRREDFMLLSPEEQADIIQFEDSTADTRQAAAESYDPYVPPSKNIVDVYTETLFPGYGEAIEEGQRIIRAAEAAPMIEINEIPGAGGRVTDDGEVIAPPAPGLSFGDQFGDVDPDLVRRGGDEELTFGDIEPTGALIPFALPVGADEDTDADVEAVVNGGGESAPAVDDAFEQDKWLALAQAGLALMSSQQPTIGGAIGEAGLSGITALRQARGERDERIERQQARADRLAAAAAAAAKGTITGTERAAYFKAAQDATKEAEDLAFALATGGVAGDYGIVTPYTDEEKEILQRRLNDARTRANRFGALANPALVNFDATLEETTE